MRTSFVVHTGLSSPLGACLQGKVWNFALFCKHARQVTLCLFHPHTTHPWKEISLDPLVNKTGEIWHLGIEHDINGFEYGYKIDENPQIFLDPYAHRLNTPLKWGTFSQETIRGVLFPLPEFDWEGDHPPQIPLKNLLIYEMHVRGFTIDPESHVHHPGTFLGMIEKIPHLKELGVNAVELMPIFEFNENEVKVKNPKTGNALHNVWGYSTLNFFTPMHRYASHKYKALEEFCLFVKECHKHKIEVYLDVVYNHTAEGKSDGPCFCFKGIDRDVYYMLDEEGTLRNFSGTGNTFNCNHPVVMQLILDSLRFWTSYCHVDGFRFDLASILTRGEDGEPLENPPLIEAILRDPVLSDVKLIAEAWDAAGLYQVGSFPGKGRFCDWNGRYRDAVRKFLKGTDSCAPDFASALCGSSTLYKKEGGSPCQSINFVTAHDGYTLRDLVSYQEKHNIENGEDNQDGANDNESWNCGIEGATHDPAIIALRERQMRNFLVALFVSIGTPMFLMGDEYTHTRFGNNNAWCQDNPLNFFLWKELEAKKEWFEFVKQLICLRKSLPSLQRDTFLSENDIDWHGIEPFKPSWEQSSRLVAYTLKCKEGKHDLYVAFNAGFEKVTLTLPPSPAWYQVVDTSLPFQDNFHATPKAALGPTYELPSYSCLVARCIN